MSQDKTKEEILKSQENANNINITHYIAEDGYIWKMILSAMETYAQHQLTQAKGEIEAYKIHVNGWKYKYDHIQSQLDQAKGEIERLNDELSGTDLEMGSMYGQIGSMQSLLTQKDKEIEGLKNALYYEQGGNTPNPSNE